MSLFADVIEGKAKELEELRANLPVEVEAEIRKGAQAALSALEEQIATVEGQVSLEREKVLYEATVEARRRVAEAYERALAELLQALYEEVERIRASERYLKFLERSLAEAAKYVPQGELVIYASPKDRGAVEAIARRLGILGMVAERDMRGGVVVSAKDGSVVVDMSLESLVSNRLEELKNLIYRRLHERQG